MAKKSAGKTRVGILMGSASDWPAVKAASQILDEFDVIHDVKVLSAHRTPHETAEYAEKAAGRGIQVIIAAAGMSAHLAGVVAAHTTVPVIGVPMPGGIEDGLDALLSTVQMPPGIPVATVAVGKAGAMNAGLLAVQIMALSDPALKRRFARYKTKLKNKVFDGDAKVQQDLESSS